MIGSAGTYAANPTNHIKNYVVSSNGYFAGYVVLLYTKISLRLKLETFQKKSVQKFSVLIFYELVYIKFM